MKANDLLRAELVREMTDDGFRLVLYLHLAEGYDASELLGRLMGALGREVQRARRLGKEYGVEIKSPFPGEET